MDKEELPEVRRSCYDCGWLKAYVSWWCTNPDAKKARGTAIPGVCHCPYWKADDEFIRKCEKKRAANKSVKHANGLSIFTLIFIACLIFCICFILYCVI